MDDQQNYTKQYRDFFSAPAGQQFIQKIDDMIASNHEQAENEPEYAGVYMSRAKGNRQIADMIKSMTTEVQRIKQ